MLRKLASGIRIDDYDLPQASGVIRDGRGYGQVDGAAPFEREAPAQLEQRSGRTGSARRWQPRRFGS